jgi:hypothetical protein
MDLYLTEVSVIDMVALFKKKIATRFLPLVASNMDPAKWFKKLRESGSLWYPPLNVVVSTPPPPPQQNLIGIIGKQNKNL